MLNFWRFLRLESAARNRRWKAVRNYHSKTRFGNKYQILADLLEARADLELGNSISAERKFNKIYQSLISYSYYNKDTLIYISNYVYYFSHIAAGKNNFRIGTDRPLNINSVNRYMRAVFFHNTDY